MFLIILFASVYVCAVYLHKDDEQKEKGCVQTLDIECDTMDQYYMLTLGFKLLLSESVISAALSKGLSMPNVTSIPSSSGEHSPFHYYMRNGKNHDSNSDSILNKEDDRYFSSAGSVLEKEDTERNTNLWLASMTFLHIDDNDSDCNSNDDGDEDDPVTSLFSMEKIKKLKLAAKILFANAPSTLIPKRKKRRSSSYSSSSSYNAVHESNMPPAQFLGWKAPGKFLKITYT